MAKGKGGFIGQDGLNAPDEPTSVSATAGDKKVTVSFTAPSDVGGSAITGYSVQSTDGSGTYMTSYDIENATFDSKSFSFSSQDSGMTDVVFNDDGTIMWMVGGSSTTSVFEYTLSTAYDVSTASYASKSFNVSSQEGNPQSVAFNDDGTKMYITGYATDAVYQYSLSTAYDVSTASYDSVSLDVSSQDTAPQKILWNPDGTKLYMLGYSSDKISQYNLSSAYDLSTASFSTSSPSFASQTTVPTGMAFKPDGTKLFVGGFSPNTVFQYSLSTAYDLSTITYDGISFGIGSYETDNRVVMFNNDGQLMYVAGPASDKIWQFVSGSGTSYPTSSPVTVTGLTNGTSYTFNVWAINAFGWSVASDASGAVSPAAPLGVFARGYTGSYTNTIDYVTMSSAGNATDWGDATSTSGNGVGTANATRGLFAASQAIDYITFSSTGNAADFGDMQDSSNGARCPTSGSNSTRGLLPRENATTYNQLQYVTFATTGNATNFGNLSVTRINTAGFSSPTRAVYAGGSSDGGSSYINNIDYVTTATTGNATDFGDQTEARGENGGASSSTRGLVLGGKKNGSYPNYWSNVIDYVTIASTGNATDFGDLTQSASGQAGASSNVKAIRAGGEGSAGTFNNIDEVTIATTGNATDFGDLTLARYNIDGGLSNAHGGLQ